MKALDAESFQVHNANPTSVATLATVIATNTVVVNGVTLTAVDADPTAAQFLVGADDTATAANIAAAVNAQTNAAVSGVVRASASGATVTFTAIKTTRAGIALSATGGSITFSHAVIASPVEGDPYALRVARMGSVVYENASLGATQALDTGTLDLAGAEEIVVVIKNGNTTVTRAPTFNFKNAAGVTMYSLTPTAIGTNTTAIYSFGRGATSTGVTAGYAITPSPKFQVTTPAPGSGTGGGNAYVWIR